MKKTIKTILATVFITAIVFGGILGYVVTKYDGMISELETESDFEYAALEREYNDLHKEYVDLQTEMNDLESDVYDVMTGNDYTISINHDDQRHTWTKEKENWLFSNKSYSISTIS